VPIFPIIKKQTTPFGMFSGLLKYPWVHYPPLEYESESDLAKGVLVHVIKLAND
jgi:hypothetical protein